MSVVLKCQRVDCTEEIEVRGDLYMQAADGPQIEIAVYTGEGFDAQGWQVDNVGHDWVLHCPTHAFGQDQI